MRRNPPPSKKHKPEPAPQPQRAAPTAPNGEPEVEYEQPSWGYQPQFIDPQQFVYDQDGRPMFFDEKGELVYAESEYPESEVSYEDYQGQQQGQSQGQNQGHNDPYHVNAPEEDIDEILSRYHRKIQQADEVLCPPVSQKIANFFTDSFRLKPASSSADYERDIMKVPRPENIEGLKLIRTDKPVWQVLHKNQRIKEERLAKVQNMIHKGACNVASIADDLRSAHKAKNKNLIDPNALIGQCYQAAQALGWASQLLVHRRREIMRPGLCFPYKQLCNDAQPFNANLFGGDIADNVRDIASTSRIAHRVSNAPRRGTRGRGGGTPETTTQEVDFNKVLVEASTTPISNSLFSSILNLKILNEFVESTIECMYYKIVK